MGKYLDETGLEYFWTQAKIKLDAKYLGVNDISDWAKASTKPTYTTNEITNFSTDVNALIATYMSEHYENGNTGSY